MLLNAPVQDQHIEGNVTKLRIGIREKALHRGPRLEKPSVSEPVQQLVLVPFEAALSKIFVQCSKDSNVFRHLRGTSCPV